MCINYQCTLYLYIQEISERYNNDGYSTDRPPVSAHVQVAFDKDDVDIPYQNITQGWNVERQQV